MKSRVVGTTPDQLHLGVNLFLPNAGRISVAAKLARTLTLKRKAQAAKKGNGGRNRISFSKTQRWEEALCHAARTLAKSVRAKLYVPHKIELLKMAKAMRMKAKDLFDQICFDAVWTTYDEWKKPAAIVPDDGWLIKSWDPNTPPALLPAADSLRWIDRRLPENVRKSINPRVKKAIAKQVPLANHDPQDQAAGVLDQVLLRHIASVIRDRVDAEIVAECQGKVQEALRKHFFALFDGAMTKSALARAIGVADSSITRPYNKVLDRLPLVLKDLDDRAGADAETSVGRRI